MICSCRSRRGLPCRPSRPRSVGECCTMHLGADPTGLVPLSCRPSADPIFPSPRISNLEATDLRLDVAATARSHPTQEDLPGSNPPVGTSRGCSRSSSQGGLAPLRAPTLGLPRSLLPVAWGPLGQDPHHRDGSSMPPAPESVTGASMLLSPESSSLQCSGSRGHGPHPCWTNHRG